MGMEKTGFGCRSPYEIRQIVDEWEQTLKGEVAVLLMRFLEHVLTCRSLS